MPPAVSSDPPDSPPDAFAEPDPADWHPAAEQDWQITVQVLSAPWETLVPAPVAVVEAAARAALAGAHAAGTRVPPLLEVTLRLTDDAEVQALNRRWRHRDQPTNVLSFPDGLALPDEPVALGDVVIAAGVVAAEAEARGLSPIDHLRHLVVHGMLHLLGFDHGEDEEALEMEALEVRCLALLGVADPYAAPDTEDADTEDADQDGDAPRPQASTEAPS